ncbi:MAG: hypothetical protein NC916_00005, partial [Candidatus Omnitrophica bacterium]|nr:hypothetical protein [Candidatus Omnitrophota bacterium]
CIITFSLIFPTALFSQVSEDARNLMISKTLDIIETYRDLTIIENQDIGQKIYQTDISPNIKRGYIIEKTLGAVEFALGINIGYLAGNTSYEIGGIDSGISWKSELVFPFDNWVGGGNILLGRHPFYLNLQGWTNIDKRTNGGMTDKDWLESILISSTESDYEAQITILDTKPVI